MGMSSVNKTWYGRAAIGVYCHNPQEGMSHTATGVGQTRMEASQGLWWLWRPGEEPVPMVSQEV